MPPCAEMVPTFPPRLLALATDQVTGTVAPVTAVAVQARELPEEIVVAVTVLELDESRQVTAAIAVAA